MCFGFSPRRARRFVTTIAKGSVFKIFESRREAGALFGALLRLRLSPKPLGVKSGTCYVSKRGKKKASARLAVEQQLTRFPATKLELLEVPELDRERLDGD